MHPILRLYPAAWRRRYGDELSDLLDELPSSPGTTLDLARGAVTAHIRELVDRLAPRLVSTGGPPMPTHPLQRHPTAIALVAALLMAPSFLLVFVSFLAYQLELPGVVAIVDPILSVPLPRVVDLFLLGAPFLAVLLALAPMVAIGASRADGELRLTLALRARALNLLVLLVGVLLAGFLLAHLVSEFLFEVAP